MNGKNIIISLFIFSSAFIAGLYMGNNGEVSAKVLFSHNENAPEEIDTSLLWDAYRILESRYVPPRDSEEVSKEERLWGMIQGLAGSYNDPYTLFLPPQKSDSFKEEISGVFGGVGIEIGIRNSILTVIAPLKNTPAEKAGILSGDYIIEINGESTQKMSVTDAVHMIRGEIGTEVVFTIGREGEEDFLTIPVVRDNIKIPTLEIEKDDDVFIISLYNFGGNAVKDMQNAVKEFVEGKYTKMIIDLRGNPGGYLEASVDIASWFLPSGAIVVQEDFGAKKDIYSHRSKGYGVYRENWDIVVLIDRGSASASEILAGALKDHGIATLIGTQSFGKGSVQELVPVGKNASLKVTIAQWLTPNGTLLSEGGIIPDYTVLYTKEDRAEERDPQKESALLFLKEGIIPQNAEEKEEEEEKE
jgi:carboxyl-terminal processing protease